MTKMPDKTHPYKLYRTFLTDTEGKTRPLLFTQDELQHFNPETEFAEYTRSDLIPQPVTDEAKAKALDFCFSENEHGEPKWGETEGAYHCFKYHADTIKAALSQPVMSDGEKRMQELEDWEPSEESKKQALSFLKSLPATSQLNENAPQLNQSGAIQKAVEALEFYANDDNHQMMIDESIGLAISNIDIDEGQTAKDALEGLLTYQSELEALKAENAELRRAVVDLDAEATKGEEGFFGKGDFLPKTTAQQKHAATIAQAIKLAGD